MSDHDELAILRAFCATGERAEVRPTLAAPWRDGAWVYATDGLILVRAPTLHVLGVGEIPYAPDLTCLAVNWSLMDDLRETPTLTAAVRLDPPGPRPDACPECAGAGTGSNDDYS